MEQELYRQEGATQRTIRVSIEPSGVVIESQDFPGPLARPFAAGGATDYSYDSRVPADAKDQLLLALLVEKYQGDAGAVEGFRNWCKAQGIPCRFSTWGSGQFD